MVYYKLVLNDKRSKTDQIYSIEVRITFNRKNTSISTRVRIKEEYWDATSQLVTKSQSQFQILNQTISENYLKIQKAIYQLRESGEFSFEALKSKWQNKPIIMAVAPTFYEFAQSLITEMIGLKQTGNARIYQTAVNRLIKYRPDQSLKFSDIVYTLLNGFKQI